ncbi:MAG: amidohydrolase family protein [Candidatus Hodarchaeota archaeon]
MKIIIKNGTLIDGTGEAPQPNTTVLIENSKIVDIGTDVFIPADSQVIDATGKTIIPGLIDAHLHLMGIRTMNPIEWTLAPPALRATRATKDVQKLIESGFTAVRCAGSDLSVYLKKAIDEGTISGPRIVAAHQCITQTAGHGDTHELPIEWVTGPYGHGRIADGVDECRKAAREQIRVGAGVIKICSTGGVMSEKDSPTQAQFVDEEIAAITTEAHRVGIKVMSHAQSPEGIQNAVRNGVDTIEHAIYLDQETIELLKAKKTIVVPTFAIVNAIVTRGEEVGTPEYGLLKAKEAHKAHLESIKKAYQAGVKIALGTDYCGPSIIPHGENAVELEILVNQVGMTPMEAIVAATKIGSEALGLEKDIGTLEKGKKADLLIVEGNPLEDISILQNKDKILVVMKDGQIAMDRR